MAYLKLFHGRSSPDEELNDWGVEGPIFGPFPYFHTTYGIEIKFDEAEGFVLPIVDGFVHYNGMYYGDWSVFDGPPEACEEESLAEFAQDLASVPEQVEVSGAV